VVPTSKYLVVLDKDNSVIRYVTLHTPNVFSMVDQDNGVAKGALDILEEKKCWADKKVDRPNI
jgi:hypothetical protein